MARLTKTVVEAEAKGAKDRFVWDDSLKGFGLKVTPSGGRIYLVQYRPRGERAVRRVTIGPHGAPWTADKARGHAAEILAKVRLGEDPFSAERDRRTSAKAAAEAALAEAAKDETLRFSKVVEEFVAKYAKPKNKRWDEAQRVLISGDLFDWRERSIAAITRKDVIGLMDKVSSRAPGATRLLFAHLRKLFAWSVERLYIANSPCQGLRGPAPAKARDRWLGDAEIGLVWRAAERLGEPFCPVIKLLLLTGQRREEVAGMRWEEIDLEKSEWTIPAERAKNGKAHMVDLAPVAAAVVRAKVRGATIPSSGLVFTTTGETPVSGFGHAKAKLDAMIVRLQAEDAARAGTPVSAPVKAWRIHDLRRTAATGMARLGHPPHVVEAVLNHISGARGGLVAVYQHYHYRPERKAALLGWGEYLGQITASYAENLS